MSKRIAALTIVLLSFGGIMIPSGFVINNFIQDLTYGSVDEGLVGIREQGIPIVIESLHEIGPASAFEIIAEQGMEFSQLLINTTIWMGHILILETLSQLIPYIEAKYWDLVENYIAGNLYNFSAFTISTGMGFPVLKGISEWYGSDLNFTFGDFNDNFTGINNLKYGVNTSETENWWGDRLPGIFEDTHDRLGDVSIPNDPFSSTVNVDMTLDRGWGIMELMGLIESANETEIKELCGPNGYNFVNPYDNFTYKGENHTKLEILYYYLTDYFFLEGLNTIVPHFSDAGSPLYDIYVEYNPRDWNGYDTSYEDVIFYGFIEQWAKCVSFDEGVDLYDAEPLIPAGTYGIEPGGPDKDSGIPMQAALQLWNETNENSLVNFPKGIQKWHNAYSGDDDAYDELLNEFSQYPGYSYEAGKYVGGTGFNETDMDLILDWLWGNGENWGHGSFSEHLLPLLIETNFNITLEDFALQVLLEQWTNGTIMGYPLYFDGFPLPLGFADIYGFEIGYQGPGEAIIPTNMSLESALALWDASSEYSIVSAVGLEMWLAATGGNYVAYQKLRIANGLTDEAMLLLLDWIPNFQQNVMPYLARYQYSLPADSITLGNIVQVAGIGIGGVCLGLGALGAVGSIKAKRKRANIKPKSKKLNPFELGS